MLLNNLRRASGEKKNYSTFTEDLWKGWELNPDCLTPYAGLYAQGQPLF